MIKHAENLEFEDAARLRDEIKRLEAVELAVSDDPLARQSAIDLEVDAAVRPRSQAGRGGTRSYRGKSREEDAVARRRAFRTPKIVVRGTRIRRGSGQRPPPPGRQRGTENVTTRLLCAIALPAAILGHVTVAQAQDTGACAPFTVKSGEDRSCSDLDFGDDGPGPRRHADRPSISGRRRRRRSGHYRWVIVGLDASPGADELGESYGIHVMDLPDGQIHIQFLTGVVSAPNDTARPSVGSSVGVVSGGTGAYAFARGVVRREFDGTSASYAVDIRCD